MMFQCSAMMMMGVMLSESLATWAGATNNLTASTLAVGLGVDQADVSEVQIIRGSQVPPGSATLSFHVAFDSVEPGPSDGQLLARASSSFEWLSAIVITRLPGPLLAITGHSSTLRLTLTRRCFDERVALLAAFTM
jgi:hypothetical protein